MLGLNIVVIVIRNTAVMQETGEGTTVLLALMHGIKLERLLQCAKSMMQIRDEWLKLQSDTDRGFVPLSVGPHLLMEHTAAVEAAGTSSSVPATGSALQGTAPASQVHQAC